MDWPGDPQGKRLRRSRRSKLMIPTDTWPGSSLGTGVTGVSPTVTLAVGTHTITLTVRDTRNATGTDTVVVTVNAFTPANQPPTANAGPDQTVTAGSGGTASVTLNGSGSSDPDAGDSIASYTWTGSSLGTGVTGVSPTVTLAVGTHTITLTVQDTKGATDTDNVQVTVAADTPPPTGEISTMPEDGSVDVPVTPAAAGTGGGAAEHSAAA